jgi:hypothetical protein
VITEELPGAKQFDWERPSPARRRSIFLCLIILLFLIIEWRVVWWKKRAYTMRTSPGRDVDELQWRRDVVVVGEVPGGDRARSASGVGGAEDPNP